MADEAQPDDEPQVISTTSEKALTVKPKEVLLSDLTPESFKFHEEAVMLSTEHEPTSVETELAILAVQAHRELQGVVPGEEALVGYVQVDLSKPDNTLMEVAFRIKPQGQEGPNYDNQIWLYRQNPLPDEFKTYDYSGQEELLADSEDQMTAIENEWSNVAVGEFTPENEARLAELSQEAENLDDETEKLRDKITKMRLGKAVFYERQQGIRQSIDEPADDVFLNQGNYVYVVKDNKPKFLGAVKDLYALSVYGGEPREGEDLEDWLKRDLAEVDQKLAREADSDDDQQKLDFLKQKLAHQKEEKNRPRVDYVTDPRGRIDQMLSEYQEWGVMDYREPYLHEPKTRSADHPSLASAEQLVRDLPELMRQAKGL